MRVFKTTFVVFVIILSLVFAEEDIEKLQAEDRCKQHQQNKQACEKQKGCCWIKGKVDFRDDTTCMYLPLANVMYKSVIQMDTDQNNFCDNTLKFFTDAQVRYDFHECSCFQFEIFVCQFWF
eukprot:TRINITY_DN271_c0_g2_i1.p2 TRINITY_DN271_c0_g2~~TRINITY_DN271_c0_g2_i1.p2  ORF type:complete len:122 (-),score=14.96 TRINITY_DN271_c0_g2_i1:198-563(-)